MGIKSSGKGNAGVWWYNTMKFSNNNVLLDTIRYFCGAFMRSPYMAMPRIIKVLSTAYEFNPNYNKEIICRPSDNTELPPESFTVVVTLYTARCMSYRHSEHHHHHQSLLYFGPTEAATLTR
ncbi:unnamed protein product, partial [Schistosoma mattheei]